MKTKLVRRLALLAALALALSLSAGCGGDAPAADPTPDPTPEQSEAASPALSTETPEPSPTASPEAEPSATPNPTGAPSASPKPDAVSTPAPTAAPAPTSTPAPTPPPATAPPPEPTPAVPAAGPDTASVTQSGGTRRATVQSPCTLHCTGGKFSAVIVWSSPNYDYMKVNGVRYDLISAPGANSTFEIPVASFDTALPVIADTVAMSEPHEVEYALTFHSSTLTKQ